MALSFDELTSNASFTKNVKGKVTLLPDPPRAERRYLMVSCDDHVVEPPHTFDTRVPKHLVERAPRVVEADGIEQWLFDGELMPNVGFNAVAGRPVDEYSFDPTRFDQMRKGTWNVADRIADMDLDGVYASLNFPSFIPGFAGQRLYVASKDTELAIACTRAWNDWMLDEWCAAAPGRFIPMQLPIWSDPQLAAAEIRKNAARGFKAVSFSEAPHMLGYPSLHTGYWDPVMEACQETGTVICLHVGSSSSSPATAPDAPSDAVGALFFAYAMFAAVDWMFSLIPVRFPNLKICLSEGGLGWVAGLIDRFDHMNRYSAMYGTWDGIAETPAEVFRRNFWFCAIDDPSSFLQVDVIGAENIMVESDYPHADTTWPSTQQKLHAQIANLPAAQQEAVAWRNAAALFGLSIPASVQADPNAY
jgi:predicted TIM-barrel fold metal-dependent hydrolase